MLLKQGISFSVHKTPEDRLSNSSGPQQLRYFKKEINGRMKARYSVVLRTSKSSLGLRNGGEQSVKVIIF